MVMGSWEWHPEDGKNERENPTVLVRNMKADLEILIPQTVSN